jgi:hypothetical protein
VRYVGQGFLKVFDGFMHCLPSSKLKKHST